MSFDSIFPFEKPRQNQKEVVERILKAFETKDFVILNAPVGFGKSAIAVAVSNYFDETYILTKQKSLQDQYTSSFPNNKNKLYTIYGKSNYECKLAPMTCDFGLCAYDRLTKGGKVKTCDDCDYYNARNDCFKNKFAIMNYDYFLNITRTENELVTTSNLLVLDECHSLEEIIVNFCTIELDKIELEKNQISIKLPSMALSDLEKLNWIRNTGIETFKKHASELKNKIALCDVVDKSLPKLMRQHSYVSTLIGTSEKLLQFNTNDQILVIHGDDKLIYKPLHCSQFAKDIMFKWGKKTLLMSATVFGKDVFTKSLDIKDYEWIDVPSTFPKENAPKILRPCGSMSYKNKQQTLPILAKSVVDILSKHKNEKGIIHTVSYDVCDYICNHVGGKRLISPRGKTRDADLKEYMEDKKSNKVLISPSLNEGISLDGDLSKFAILCKVPYASLGDKWIAARLKESQSWYNVKTTQSIVQMCGRSVRSETDHAITYFLDSDFINFLERNEKMFPTWWLETLKVNLS